jgi:fructose-specific phosphotransferase system IIC component
MKLSIAFTFTPFVVIPCLSTGLKAALTPFVVIPCLCTGLKAALTPFVVSLSNHERPFMAA